MPSGSFKQADVLCPFYKYDDGKRRITCEGIIDDSSVALIYHRRADYEAQILRYCCQGYGSCGVYRLLMKKYNEED